MIVHLNGWPGVGKRTIGECLAKRLGARFVHNHLLHDVAIACCGLGDPGRWTLYDAVRAAAYEALAARPASESFVMTNALCDGCAREEDAWRHVVDLARRRGVRLVPIVLEADLPENRRRVASLGRAGRTLSDPELLASLRATATLQKPPSPDLLALDVTHLAAEDAAERLHRHVENRRSAWQAEASR